MPLCRQSLATTRHNTVGDHEQSTAAEVIASQARPLLWPPLPLNQRHDELSWLLPGVTEADLAGRDCGNRRQERLNPARRSACGQPRVARPNRLSFSSAIDEHAAVD
jgi:hypothetical protein